MDASVDPTTPTLDHLQLSRPAALSTLDLCDLHHSIYPSGDKVPSKDKGAKTCDAQQLDQEDEEYEIVLKPDDTSYQPVFDTPFLCDFIQDSCKPTQTIKERLLMALKTMNFQVLMAQLFVRKKSWTNISLSSSTM
jgi:hypothetical protein